MPLGDSITESRAGHASYRYWLWHDLSGAGYEVDLVGSRAGVRGGAPLYPDFDQDHEGHWGWRTDQILDSLGVWIAESPPAIALIHLGTNDLFQGQTIASTVDELEEIVGRLRAADSAVAILLAQIIPMREIYGVDSIPAFNEEVAALASRLHDPASPVISVDQFTGFDPNEDTWDGVHPDESGERKITARWMERLVDLLPNPVGLEPAEGMPQFDISILPPSPNPAGGPMEFRLILPWRMNLRLSVHDAGGRQVALVADCPLGPGVAAVSWSGRPDAIRSLPAGAYFLRVAGPSAGGAVRFVRLSP